MQPALVVEFLHIRKQVTPGFVAGGIGSVMHQLGLERVEEAFHRRIVQRVGPPAHGRRDAGFVQCCLVVAASVLLGFNRSSQRLRAPTVTLRQASRQAFSSPGFSADGR